MDSHLDIKAIIDRAGGATAIMEASRSTVRPIASEKTVYKWQKSGIPQWHIGLMADLSGLSPMDVLGVNQEVWRSRSVRRRRNHGTTASA